MAYKIDFINYQQLVNFMFILIVFPMFIAAKLADFSEYAKEKVK